MSTPPSSSKLISGNQCSNIYVCPGSGSGFAIHFNIIENDVSMLSLSSGYTVAIAAANDYVNIPQKALTNSPLTWWWKNIVLLYEGLPGSTPMTCVQPGQGGFATGLAQTLVTAFGVSPSRICNAQLTPILGPNSYDITKIKFTFFITDVAPRTVPLANDYLPSACIGPWMLSWIAKSTNVTDPTQASLVIPSTIPSNYQSNSCPALIPGLPTPTLYFTSKVNSDENISEYIENIKKSIGASFSNQSFLNNIFVPKKIEHATNFVGTSLQLSGLSTSIYATPRTLIDYYGMFAYPLAFIGAVLFSIIQVIDVNLNSIFVNKNLSLLINLSFIIWSIIGLTTYFNISPSGLPYIGQLFTFQIPYILPFNPQTVITQY
jgi:hypothetical protein